MTPLSPPAEQGTVAGWKLVPKIATREMLDAFFKTMILRRPLAECWTAALTASPSPEALPASGVEAPEYVVGVGELGPKGHVYYVLSGGGMGEAVARVYPGPDAERTAKVMAAALTSAPAPEDRT